MKLLALAALSLLVLAAPPAHATGGPCYLDDAPCMINCLANTPCAVYNPNVTFIPCPTGDDGAGVNTGAHTVTLCLPSPSVTLGSCPDGGRGVVVIVDGQPHPACLGG
jgi:hypothetical protein